MLPFGRRDETEALSLKAAKAVAKWEYDCFGGDSYADRTVVGMGMRIDEVIRPALEAERAAVVAWLVREAAGSSDPAYQSAMSFAARRINVGEHREESCQ